MTAERFFSFVESIERTPSRLEMTRILSDLFSVSHEKEIRSMCYLLIGRVGPRYEPLEFGVADAFMIRAIARSYGASENDVRRVFQRTGDLGTTAQEFARARAGKNPSRTVDQMLAVLTRIAKTSGQGSQEEKVSSIAELLAAADPLSARYIVRIPLGKMRLGFSDMTLLDALSWMIAGDKSRRARLEEAYSVRPDIGYIASVVKEKGIEGLADVDAKPGVPVLPALCQRLPTADEMIKKMGTVAVEPKFDGLRVQIHYQKSKIKNQKSKILAYSRNLENTTDMYPELEDIGRYLNAESVILDSEAIGVDPKTGRLVPFQETTTRKRKHNISKAAKSVPLRFYVFDILVKDGTNFMDRPLSERRRILEKTVRAGGNILHISEQCVTDRAEAVREYHDEQLKKGLEGAVVKKWNSPYRPGRRDFTWVKFKEEEGSTGKLSDTIDAVVMGYYRGEGKRSGLGIGAFLVGVRDQESFVTVSKIGTGVTDVQWQDLVGQFRKIETKSKPKEYAHVDKTLEPDVWLEPAIIAEIAGDNITKSKIHGATYAIRFPRLVRIRTDKSPSESTTVKELASFARNQ